MAEESVTWSEWGARVAFLVVLFVISGFLFGVDDTPNSVHLGVSAYTLEMIEAARRHAAITYHFLVEEHSKFMAGVA